MQNFLGWTMGARKIKKDRSRDPVFARELILKYTCPETQEEVEVDISGIYVTIIGGCTGTPFCGPLSGSYCYCPTPEPYIDVECPSCSGYHPYTFS